MMVKNFFILQLGVKMKKSKRYIKKQNNKPLINKKVLAKVIRRSNICKHAIKELKLTVELEEEAYEEMRNNK